MRQANLIDQGVQVDWLESQPGAYPISGYIIERSRDQGKFRGIGRVEKDSRRYIDNEGRVGDAYRIVAEDSRGPAGRSAASEAIAATPVKPGSTVVVSSTSSVLGVSTVPAGAATPDEKAAALQESAIRAYATLDSNLAGHDIASARNSLQALQAYQHEMLSLWPQLSADRKKALAQACTEQMGVFEPNLHNLSEQDRLDGMIVLAGCDALQESIQ